jgi:hypothetical protein
MVCERAACCAAAAESWFEPPGCCVGCGPCCPRPEPIGIRGCSPTANGLASIGTIVGWKGGEITGKGAIGTLLTGTIGGAEGEYWPVAVKVVGLVTDDCGLLVAAEAGRERLHGWKCCAAGLWVCRPESSSRNIPVSPMTVLPMIVSPEKSNEAASVGSRPRSGW